MSPLGLLTRWLGWRFMKTYLVFAFTAAMVFVLVDGLVNMRNLEWGTAIIRWARMLPELFYMLSPFFTLLSALWVLAALLRSREMVGLAAAGYSPRQVGLPFLALALVLAPVSWADRELLLPALADLRRAHASSRRIPPPRPLPDAQGGVLTAQRFNPATQELVRPRYVRLTADGREDWSIIAESARYSRERGGWIFERGVEIRSGEQDSITSIPAQGTFMPSEIRLSDVHAAIWSPDFLSAAQLKEQIGRTPLFRHLAVQYYERFTQPLAGVVLLLISIPIVLGGEGQGSFLRFLACIGIGIAYFVLNTLTFELGARNALAPGLAAALPLLVTGGLGAVLIWRSR
jgi:lipopolysaccharide export system permease protein